MRLSIALLAALTAMASGCVRVDLDVDSGESEALVLSEQGAVVLCPVAASTSLDTTSVAVVWQEYPADADMLQLMFARIGVDGSVEIPATPVASLDAELGALSLDPIDGGFAVGMVSHGDDQRVVVTIDDAGVLGPSGSSAGEIARARVAATAASAGDVTCHSSAAGIASAYRGQLGDELRLVLELAR